MLRNIFLYNLIVLVLAMAPSAHAGKVELTTYYPAPFGEYSSLNAADSFIPPRKTTAQRTAIIPVQGMVIFNTDTTRLEVYDGSNWVAAGTNSTPSIFAATTSATVDATSYEDLVQITLPSTFPGGSIFVTFEGDYEIKDRGDLTKSEVTFRILYDAVSKAVLLVKGAEAVDITRRVDLWASFNASAGAHTIKIQGLKTWALVGGQGIPWTNPEGSNPRLTVYT